MTNELSKIDTALNEANNIIDSYFDDINNLIADKDLKGILIEYDKHKREHNDSGFNIFNLVSDKYHYENLHSDIISVFLDKNGAHKEGDIFLKIFIKLLQGLRPELLIDIKEFSDAIVTREKDHIDILIVDSKSHKAIIIENKINNASDTYRQLPTYIRKIGKENVVAILYLPLDPNKKPDDTDWTPAEKKFIKSKIICLPAYQRTDSDLHNGWLQFCIKEAKKDDTINILKQYSKLIQKIGGFIMDKRLYGKFYDKIIDDSEFYNTTLSIKSLIENMSNYRAEKAFEHFKENFQPFSRFKVYDNSSVLFQGYELGGREFRLFIECADENNSDIRFYDEHYDTIEKREAVNNRYTKQIIQQLKKINLRENDEKDEFIKSFSFPTEQKELYSFVKEFMNELKRLQKLDFKFTK